jgi:SAM-dependent methyltransferase
MQRIEAELAEAQRRVAELESEIAAARRSAEDFERQIDAARRGAEDFERQISAARRSSEDYEAQLAEARRAARDYQQQISAARRAGRECEEQVRGWREYAENVEADLRSALSRHSGRQGEPEEVPDPDSDGRVESKPRAACLPPAGRSPARYLLKKLPLSTPLPPPELIHLVSGHRDEERFAESRVGAVDTIFECGAEAGIDFDDVRVVLELGCGCGRILAGWEPYDKRKKLYGVDYNPTLVHWCQENLPFARVSQNALYPPLDFPDSLFDLVYAASVFTHLDLEVSRAWARELCRVTRPGGFFFASFQGSHYHRDLERLSPEGYAQLLEKGFCCHIQDPECDPQEDSSPTTGSHALEGSQLREGSNLYSTYHSVEGFESLFEGFRALGRFVSSERGPTDFAAYQDIVILRRS